MTKQLNITLDEEVYRRLQMLVGEEQISSYIERLVRPHVLPTEVEEGYRAMAADTAREEQAMEWSENLIGDVSHEAR